MTSFGGDNGEEARRSCEETWQQALARCKEILGEDDYELVVAYENPDELLKAIDKLRCAYSEGIIARLLKNIRPELSHLQTFALAILLSLQPSSINAACIWGTAQLLIELASRSEAALREVFEMLSDIGQSLKLFEIYSSSISLDSQLLEELFEILVDLVLFSVSAIKHFRRNEIETATMIITWSNVRAGFTTVARNIAKKVNRLKERIEAENMKQMNTTQARLVSSLKNLGISLGTRGATTVLVNEEAATLPCNTLTLPRNPGFHGRSTILDQITTALQNGPENEIRSIALWGTGGIGKSQIALEYASKQATAGIPVVLWIFSETAAEISAGFNQAAQQLQLPGYQSTNTPDQNRYEVLQWLQKTSVSWLIVFDNIEDGELLHQNWPVHGSGSILVTCRSEMMAAAPAASAIEVPVFTNDEGGELIMKILSREESEGDDILCASELSEKLGGLALAIDMMAKQIRTRKKTIKQFKIYYDENHRVLHKLPKRGIYNPYYSKGLDTVWATAFENLSDHAQSFMALLTYFAPESIPQKLWEGPQKLAVNSRFSFLFDDEEANDAQIELLDSALISVNPQKSTLSVHRLTQVAFRDRLSPEDSIESFHAALVFLRNNFPEQLDGQHLRGQWMACEVLIQHVQAFGQRYMELVRDGFDADLEVLTMLFSDAAWSVDTIIVPTGSEIDQADLLRRYLHETGAHENTLKILEFAFTSCKDLGSIAYSNLGVTAGTVYDQRGQGGMATVKFKEVIDIREKLLPWNHPELANAYNNVAVSLTGIYQPAEALMYLEKAIKIDFSLPTEDQVIKSMIDMRYRNLARTYTALGRYEEAKDAASKAKAASLKKHTAQAVPYYIAEVNHIQAKIAMLEGRLDDARRFEESAVTDFAKHSALHPAVASARYHLGLIYMRQGDLVEALKSFEGALGICQLREVHKGDKGETARVKWRISQIKKLQGEHAEAETLQLAAEATFDALHATGKYTPGVNKEQGYDNLISFLYR